MVDESYIIDEGGLESNMKFPQKRKSPEVYSRGSRIELTEYKGKKIRGLFKRLFFDDGLEIKIEVEEGKRINRYNFHEVMERLDIILDNPRGYHLEVYHAN